MADNEQDDKKTNAKKLAAKNVRIKTVRAILIDGKVIPPETTLNVTEEDAKEFCDRKFKGYMPFYGPAPQLNDALLGRDENGNQIRNPLAVKEVVRAIRLPVATAASA